MAKNITIAGASYTGVPAVNLQQTSGGTAKFVDTSGDTVTAETLLSGYTAHGADGEPITGTLEPVLYDEAFNAGKKAERDSFWDIYQKSDNGIIGGAADYSYRFYYLCWTDENYKPKYPIRINAEWRASAVFTHSKITNTVVDIIAEAKVNFNATFGNCLQLVTIPRLVVTKDCYYTNTFLNCTALENLNIEGVIGGKGFDVSPCTKLTHDSLMTIINALENKTSGTWTVTLGTANLAKLTDAEKAIATGKGWTLA